MTTVEIEVPSRPEYVGVVRLAVASLGRFAGLDEATVDDLKIAVSEATTSAMLANQEAGDAPVAVAWTSEDGRVVVEVCDRRPVADARRTTGEDPERAGISVALLESIVDGCEVVPRGDGPGTCTRLFIGH